MDAEIIHLLQWIAGGVIGCLFVIAGFFVKRLISEQDSHRKRLHDHQDEILKLNGAMSMLKEIFRDWIKKRQ